MESEIFEKELLLTRVDFDKEKKPRLKLGNQEKGEIYSLNLNFEEEITIEIDTSKRFCIGWHDLKTGEDFLCPERAEIDKKYEQCQECQRRTGFNPAFYNAAQGDISAQQLERNSQPHFVYLAYFSENVIKVGISFCGRGVARLLEQGARAAMILGEFSSANVARNYEAKISSMPDFCENVKANLKMKLIEEEFSFEKAKNKLILSKEKIEKALNVKFDESEVLDFSEFYSKGKNPSGEMISFDECEENSGEKIIFSGILKAQFGYILVAEQQDELIILPIRKFVGNKIKISKSLTRLTLPAKQVSLFGF